MATITLNITDEQKKFLTDYSNSNNINFNNINFNNIFALFIAYLEDMEDTKTIEKIVNDSNTKYSEGMEDLAKECGIDYEVL